MPSNTHTVIGGTKRLECRVIGHPPPDIRWFKDGRDITRSDRYNFDYNMDDGVISMVIENISHKDQGNYRCRAENTEGFASTSAYLLVRAHREHPGEEFEEVHSMELEEHFVYMTDGAHSIETERYSETEAARKRTFEQIVDEEKENTLEGRYRHEGKDFSGKKSSESTVLSEMNAEGMAYSSRQEVDEVDNTQETHFKKKKTVLEESSSISLSEVAVRSERESLLEMESSMTKSSKVAVESRSESSFATKMETEAVSTSKRKPEESSFSASSSVEETSLKARKESRESELIMGVSVETEESSLTARKSEAKFSASSSVKESSLEARKESRESEMVLGVSVETEESSSRYSKSKSGKTLVASIKSEESNLQAQKTSSADVTEMEVSRTSSIETTKKSAANETEKSLIASVEMEESTRKSAAKETEKSPIASVETEESTQKSATKETDKSLVASVEIEESVKKSAAKETEKSLIASIETEEFTRKSAAKETGESITVNVETEETTEKSAAMEIEISLITSVETEESRTESKKAALAAEVTTMSVTESEKEQHSKMTAEAKVEEARVEEVPEECRMEPQDVREMPELGDLSRSMTESEPTSLFNDSGFVETSLLESSQFHIEESIVESSTEESSLETSPLDTGRASAKEEEAKRTRAQTGRKESHVEESQVTQAFEEAMAVQTELVQANEKMDISETTSTSSAKVTREASQAEEIVEDTSASVAELESSEENLRAQKLTEKTEVKEEKLTTKRVSVSQEESHAKETTKEPSNGDITGLLDEKNEETTVVEEQEAVVEEVLENRSRWVDQITSRADTITMEGERREVAELKTSEETAVTAESSQSQEDLSRLGKADVSREESRVEPVDSQGAEEVSKLAEAEKTSAAEMSEAEAKAKASKERVEESSVDPVSLTNGVEAKAEDLAASANAAAKPTESEEASNLVKPSDVAVAKDSSKEAEENGLTLSAEVDTEEIKVAGSTELKVSAEVDVTEKKEKEKLQASADVDVSGSEAKLAAAGLNPPRIVSVQDDVTVELGEAVRLTSQVQGNPQPEVKWFKEGDTVKAGERITLRTENDVFTLEINEAAAEDAGTYTLTAHNSQGTIFSDVLVTVNIPPSIGLADEELTVTARLSVPEFVVQPGNVTVRELGTLELVCSIKANPSPTVSWSKEGKPLQADGHMRIFESEGQYYLEIPRASMDDTGDYTCTASNSEGSVSCTISVFVESRESSVSATEEGAAAMVPLGQRESSSDVSNASLEPATTRYLKLVAAAAAFSLAAFGIKKVVESLPK